MPTATFQLERYVRKNERFPFDWTTCRGTARALENFRRQDLSETEAAEVDTAPGRYYVGQAEYELDRRKPKIVVTNRWAAEHMPPYKTPWACISITDPTQQDANINQKNCIGLLRLKFYDLASPLPPRFNEVFTPEHARQVLAFAASVWPKADILHVHCEAGVSRSAGTAAALSRLYFGDDGEFVEGPVYRPNKLVYDTILNQSPPQDARPKQPREEEESNS